jgi:GNAT superfamily N-acetyltransferase
MDVTIVTATVADADAVVRMIRELAESGGGTARIDAAYVGRYLGFPGRTVLLAVAAGTAESTEGTTAAGPAESNDECVGLLAYSLDPNLYHAADGCLIEDLYVVPSWRGRGIGRALVACVLAEAERRGCAEVSVSTDRDNRAALSLYRGMGLVEEYVLLEKHF